MVYHVSLATLWYTELFLGAAIVLRTIASPISWRADERESKRLDQVQWNWILEYRLYKDEFISLGMELYLSTRSSSAGPWFRLLTLRKRGVSPIRDILCSSRLWQFLH